MTKDWYPVIDYSKCAKCFTCVKFCPHGVYEEKEGKPLVKNPEACIDMCRGCEKICPENAITHLSSSNSGGKTEGGKPPMCGYAPGMRKDI